MSPKSAASSTAAAMGLKSTTTTFPRPESKTPASPIASAPLRVPKSAYKPFFNSSFPFTATPTKSTMSSVSVLADHQNLIKRMENTQESDGDSDVIATQVRRLAMEVRQLASARQITVLNGSSGQSNLASLIMPAAALGAVGYGYMWWKGLSFSDLMYVTKQNMTNAVTNLTKHLDHVSEALAATKRHLTQRIENLDGKLDEQVEISKLIKGEVNDVRGDVTQIGFDLDELQRLVSGLDGKLLSLEGKQELTNAGVMYLCGVVNGRKVTMPEVLKEQLKIGGNSTPALMGSQGLKAIADSLLLENESGENDSDKLKTIKRAVSSKC